MKDSNPKEALGVKKVPLHAVPVKPLLEVGLAMMEGGRKFGTHNYRSVGVRMSTYYDAALRHLTSWWEGEDIDPDSGVHHLVKAMACLFVVRDGMHMGNCVDDRPIRYPDGIDMRKFNKIAASLITKYPECAKPFTWHTDDYNAAEIDGPEFKNGDVVKIVLRDTADPSIRALCADVKYQGTYIRPTGKVCIVSINNDNRLFYNDEIFPVEDN